MQPIQAASTTSQGEDLIFADEDIVFADETTPPQVEAYWKILIVDDDAEVQEVTKLALHDVTFEGKSLAFISANSAQAAKHLIQAHPDIAIVLLDVVMETDHAGLDFIKYLREDLDNQLVRIILRTGQPGQAPEKAVVLNYAIDDYKTKTELTAQKLLISVVTALRAYSTLMQLQDGKRKLEQAMAQRQQAEQQALEQQALLDAFVANAPIGIGILDLAYRFLHVNELFADIDGSSVEAHRGKTMSEVMPELAPTLEPLYQQVLLTGQSLVNLEITGEVPSQPGVERTWYISCFPIYLQSEQPLALALTVIEITDRKQAEKARLQLAAIVESSADAIISTTLDGVVVSWNVGAEQVFGYTAAEILNQSILQLVPAERHHEARRILEALQQGERIEHFETVRQRKDGTIIDVALTISPLKDAAGKIIGTSKIARDVSARKQAEAALRQSEIQLRQRTEQLEQTLQDLGRTQAQLVQSEKMSSLGQLVAGIAHEINNPINFIFGNLVHASEYAHGLLELLSLYQLHYPTPHIQIQEKSEEVDLEFLKEDMPKLLHSMQVGSQRIREIVHSLRVFSRLDEAEVKGVDIHEGIDSTLMILQNRLKAKHDHPGIQVIKEYGQLPPIECYAGQLNQVFMNLLSNAIDALEDRMKSIGEAYCFGLGIGDSQFPTPIIRIQTEVLASQHIAIRIKDNGSGIPELVQKRLFDPFFTTKAVGKGTGMGLAISYQIVAEKHRGQLRCHSIPGEGTEFIIEIPVRQYVESHV